MTTVRILSNVIEPRPESFRGARFVGKVLRSGAVVDLEDGQAEILIEAEKAVEYEAPADADPKKDRKKELGKLKPEELDALLLEKKLPVEGKKAEKVAAILDSEFPE